jgi:hypothetical protein
MAGMDDVVAKPVQVIRLWDAIEGVLGAQELSAPGNSAAA